MHDESYVGYAMGYEDSLYEHAIANVNSDTYTDPFAYRNSNIIPNTVRTGDNSGSRQNNGPYPVLLLIFV